MSNELDAVLAVLGNPVRRRIIKRLSEEASYPLELSGDLSVNQQLITKHLKVMEDVQVVRGERESSPYGPARRMYNLIKSVSLTIDFSPDLFGARILSFGDISPSSRSEKIGEFEDRLGDLSSEDAKVIDPFAELISDIDRRIGDLESERAGLLHIRSAVMRAAKESIRGKDVSISEKMVAYHILNRNIKNANRISKSLDLRKDTTTQILNRLRDESILR